MNGKSIQKKSRKYLRNISTVRYFEVVRNDCKKKVTDNFGISNNKTFLKLNQLKTIFVFGYTSFLLTTYANLSFSQTIFHLDEHMKA